MKKMLLMLPVICLLFCSLNSAFANEWGLRGGLYDVVTEDDRYDDYTAAADSGNNEVQGRHVNQAVMTSRYHNQLLAAFRDGREWKLEAASTTAVYQPDDERAGDVILSHTHNGFRLSYGNREYWDFAWQDGAYVLVFALYDRDTPYACSLVLTEENRYLLWESGAAEHGDAVGDARWDAAPITLQMFNIAQMPRSMADVRCMNRTADALSRTAPPLQVQQVWSGQGAGRVKLSVYSAPDDTSFRAAKGKASVSVGDRIDIYGQVGDWTLISYAVSGRTSRFGFVNGLFDDGAPELVLDSVPLITARDTFLTDDPFVSQYAQAYIPAGTRITGLAAAGDYYAYVATEQDGKLMWGFVPMKDVYPEYDYTLSTGNDVRTDSCQWDVVDQLVGKWQLQEGGEGWADVMILYSEGGYRCSYWVQDAGETGNMRIKPCPADAPYADCAQYEVCFVTDANEEVRFGLTLDTEGGLILYSPQDSAVYIRYEYSTFGNG